MHTLAIDEAGQVWSWGINDNAALGRITTNVPKPDAPGETIPNEDLESYPFVVESLKKEGFRAVQVQAGDSVSVAVSDAGAIRVWGSFRVSASAQLFYQGCAADTAVEQRRCAWIRRRARSLALPVHPFAPAWAGP